MLHRPVDLNEALDLLGHGGIVPLSGGTDVFPALVDRPHPASFLDLTRLDDLRGVAPTAQGWRIGAGTTWRAIAQADLPPVFAMLQAAARTIGSVQIQNRGSIGGNLCNASPAADGVPPLLALDAEVELASLTGVRRMPLERFLLGNRRTARRADELLVALNIPAAPQDMRSSFQKLGARKYLVISIVMVAAALSLHDGRVREARIAVGSASAVARRLRALEARLVGHALDIGFADLLTDEDLTLLSPIDDIRATGAYRLDAARELVGRALAEAAHA